MENELSSSPLFGKLSGRYGTSGFSMGGGGTTFSAAADPTLRTNVSIMAWTPATSGITVPSLYIFGSADTLAGTMGMPSYDSIADDRAQDGQSRSTAATQANRARVAARPVKLAWRSKRCSSKATNAGVRC